MGFWERLFGVGDPYGEMSALRDARMTGSFGSIFKDYSLDSSRVDYPLARSLYRNKEDRYKLGAWAAKPVVNTAAGFMGAPQFRHDDPEAQAAIDEGPNKWEGKFLRINRDGHRDGDVYVRLIPRTSRFAEPGELPEIETQIIAPEWVEPTYDSLTGEFSEVIINWPVYRKQTDKDGRTVQTTKYTVTERITKTERTLVAGQGAPAGAQSDLDAMLEEDKSNPYGFIPIVHFRNEADANALFGQSELEPIEPFMKAYHDTLKAAIQGARMMAKPKTQFQLKDVEKFLIRNFGADYRRQEKLDFAGRDVFLMFEGETVDVLTADSGLVGITTLLEFIFYCVVDVSETPEFAFGTAVASSKASVSEQMPVLGRRIDRKRGEWSDPYREYCSMYLALKARLGQLSISSYTVDIDWSEFSPKDEGETATMLVNLVNALVTGVNEGLISHEAAVDFARQYIPTMLDYVIEGKKAGEQDEKQRIIDGLTFLERLRSGEIPNPTEIDQPNDNAA